MFSVLLIKRLAFAIEQAGDARAFCAENKKPIVSITRDIDAALDHLRAALCQAADLPNGSMYTSATDWSKYAQ